MHEVPFKMGANRVSTTISIDDRRDKLISTWKSEGQSCEQVEPRPCQFDNKKETVPCGFAAQGTIQNPAVFISREFISITVLPQLADLPSRRRLSPRCVIPNS